MVNDGLNLLFNVVLSSWTRGHIFVVVWLVNRICVGTNSVSRCLLMASMTRFVVHFRLSTTYQEQNMSMWWACTFHLIIFSGTHSSQRLFTLSVMGGKDFSVQCHKWALLRPISSNWFCEAREHWNACQQLILMLNPSALHMSVNQVHLNQCSWTEVTKNVFLMQL